jgi:large subunit ribosomal protein L9
MEVILREDVEKLGTRGQVVKVANGYARNFLLPNKLAVAASDSNRKIVEQERQAHLRREAKEKASAEELGKLLAAVTLATTQKAGEGDVLFGSVTVKDIAEMLEKQSYTIDRKKIHLDAPIKSLGEHKVTIRLHPEVSVEITVIVNKEKEKEAEESAE